MFFQYPINDVHIHVFDPDDLEPCIQMVNECGYEHWTFLACTLVDGPFALTQNLLCALAKLRENGRCQAFGSFHYDGDRVPDADELLRQIKWFSDAGFDGIKMLDGKPGVRQRQNLPLDATNYDKMFDFAERTQFPILYHINDPIEFWYKDRLPEWAVDKDYYYGGGDFPHKYEIDQETFGILHKHPNLNLCIPHFFFISDQPGLCGELLDRYPNLYFDITPGWEMFENFAKDWAFWRAFFSKYSHKILFGSDTFSDHWRETVSCLKRVMETQESFVAFEENCVGLDLPKETLSDIYYRNYDKFVRRTDRRIDVDMILTYADSLYALIPNDENYALTKSIIDRLKQEIARFKNDGQGETRP